MKAWLQRIKSDWKQLAAEYGPVALFTYLVIFALAGTAIFIAIKTGFQFEGVDAGDRKGFAALIFSTWVGLKLTQPLRILLTIALTPFVAKILRADPKSNEDSETEHAATEASPVIPE